MRDWGLRPPFFTGAPVIYGARPQAAGLYIQSEAAGRRTR